MESRKWKVFLSAVETIVSSLAFCGVRIDQCRFNLLYYVIWCTRRKTKMFCCLVREKKNEKSRMTGLFLITEFTKCVQKRIEEIIR